MSIQGFEIASQRVGFLIGSAVLVVIDVTLIALALAKQPVEQVSIRNSLAGSLPTLVGNQQIAAPNVTPEAESVAMYR